MRRIRRMPPAGFPLYRLALLINEAAGTSLQGKAVKQDGCGWLKKHALGIVLWVELTHPPPSATVKH